MSIPSEFFDGTFGISREFAAVIAGLFVTFYHEEKSAMYHDFKNIGEEAEFDASQAAVTLLHICRKFLVKTGNAGLETDLTQIQESLKLAQVTLESKKNISCDTQIIVFDQKTGNLLQMIPSQFDESTRSIFLLGTKQAGKTVVSGIITNIVHYFEKSKFSFFCLFCQKRFSGKGSSHKCRQRRSCFACHKYLLRPNTYQNRVIENLFCTDEMAPRIKKICSQCNVSIRNKSCGDTHKKRTCRWGWFCLKCETYTFKNKYLRTIKAIKESHLCKTKICHFCSRPMNRETQKEHLCPLQKLIPRKNATKLAFLQMSFRGRSASYCKECLITGKVCLFCRDEDAIEQPNIAVLLLETSKPGCFNSYTFADFDLFNYVKKEREVLQKNYLPESLQQRPSGKTTCFNQTKKVKIAHNTFTGTGVIDQILQFILYTDFSNTTLVINAKETNELYFFVQTLIQYGFKPQILKTENRLLLVDCPELCLRIIDAQNYITFTHEEIALEEGIDFHYFPKKWNKQKQYNYKGRCPDLSCFFAFEDTAMDERKKEKFIQKFSSSSWEFRKEIWYHTRQKVFLTAVSVLNMLHSCFELQTLLCQTYDVCHKTPLHPMNQPFLTYAGFIYQLFLSFCTADLRMVEKSVEYQSSRAEIEFAQYLSFTHNRKLIDAWSPYGQYKLFLPICVPDIFDMTTKTAYFFNGCVVHNHEPQKCKFKRSTTRLFQNQNNFFKKVQKLALSPKIQNIRVLWQCEWLEQKKTNLDVKPFMSKIYTNPPPFRLDVRCAGKKIIDEYMPKGP